MVATPQIELLQFFLGGQLFQQLTIPVCPLDRSIRRKAKSAYRESEPWNRP